MRYVAIDSETHLIPMRKLGKKSYVVGTLTPPLVCVSACFLEGDPADEGSFTTGLLDRSDGLDLVEDLLTDEGVVIVGANLAYDMAVFANERPHLLPLIYAAYESGRAADVQVREKLVFLARGWLSYDPVRRQKPPRFSLAQLVSNRFGTELSGKGGDGWRLRYGELADVPLEDWAKAAKG